MLSLFHRKEKGKTAESFFFPPGSYSVTKQVRNILKTLRHKKHKWDKIDEDKVFEDHITIITEYLK